MINTVTQPTWTSCLKSFPENGQVVRVLIKDPFQGKCYEPDFKATFTYFRGSKELPYFYQYKTQQFVGFVDKWMPILDHRGNRIMEIQVPQNVAKESEK